MLLLLHLTRTYRRYRHRDAHGNERSRGHRAVLVGQSEAAVITEEPSLVRREGRFVQQHANKKHCIVGQIHEGRRGNALGTQLHKGTNIFRYKKKKAPFLNPRVYDNTEINVQISSHHGFIKQNEDMMRKQSPLLLFLKYF